MKKKIRIIPTRVGTSQHGQSRISWTQDHPHACGDKIFAGADMPPHRGSSPRVWGQDNLLNPVKSEYRIIPTRVGTRHLFGVLAVAHRDHPHACGDKDKKISYMSTYLGSSPRVWGQVMQWASETIANRIIPTRVGTRHTYRLVKFQPKDHPHACGDKPIVIKVFSPE